MQSTLRLEDAAWVSGGTRQIRLHTLPQGKRVRRFSLFFDLSGTKSAADALSADLFAKVLSLIQLTSTEGPVWVLPGMETWRLMQAEAGRQVQRGTDVPGSGTTFTMQFHLDLSFRDESQPGTDDGSLSTSLFRAHMLELTFASATVWGVGTLALTAGTVRVEAELVEEDNVPQLSWVKFIDLASGMAVLDQGIIKTAILCDAAGDQSITQAEIGMVGLTVDGNPVHPLNTLHESLVSLWNADRCVQGGTPHELAVNAALFLPYVWTPRKGGNLTKQPAVEKQGEARIVSGSLTSPRLVVRLVRLKTDTQAAKLAVQTGAPADAGHYEPAVASKSPPRSVHESQRRGEPTKKARLSYAALPGKLRRTPTVGMTGNKA